MQVLTLTLAIAFCLAAMPKAEAGLYWNGISDARKVEKKGIVKPASKATKVARSLPKKNGTKSKPKPKPRSAGLTVTAKAKQSVGIRAVAVTATTIVPTDKLADESLQSPLVRLAMMHVGKNPTGWSRRWCGKFLDIILQKAGYPGGSNLARAYTSYGKPSPARVGAIAVMNHHVGIVTSVGKGYVMLVSGNNRGKPGARTVGVSKYPVKRILAFRMPA